MINEICLYYEYMYTFMYNVLIHNINIKFLVYIKANF